MEWFIIYDVNEEIEGMLFKDVCNGSLRVIVNGWMIWEDEEEVCE